MSQITPFIYLFILFDSRVWFAAQGLERTTSLCRTILVVDNRLAAWATYHHGHTRGQNVRRGILPAEHHESFSSGQQISRKRHQNIHSSRWTRSYKSGLVGGSSTPELPSSLQAKDQEQWWVRIQIWCTDPVSQEVQRSCSDSRKRGYTRFTPHYITWYCPEAFLASRQCKSQCINWGRYYAPDSEQDFSRGYNGKDVVVQSLQKQKYILYCLKTITFTSKIITKIYIITMNLN